MLTAKRINTFLKYRAKSFPPSPLFHILTINHLNWLKNKMFIALTFKREGTKDGLRNLSGNWSSDVSIFHLIKWLCWCLSERSDVPCTHTDACISISTLWHEQHTTHSHTNYSQKSIIRFYSTSWRNDLFMESLSDENYTPFQSPSLKGVLIVATQKETFSHTDRSKNDVLEWHSFCDRFYWMQ